MANNLYIEDWFRGFRFRGDFLFFSAPREYRGLLDFPTPIRTHNHLCVCVAHFSCITVPLTVHSISQMTHTSNLH